ncbi:YhcN/YlaJ family sporulation lipoprotein [Brevibacillus sp. SYP-B805]|uniref:YhcN/YlaJ family sporulation lipoprotein n=1 Tax=Brevibacillus sp. SYP-B805 TaxID=1578199 RepID=UPI001F497E50|nr:YhcN/YlaJ family sporulation lipoprotein [Brevibacillus sp. SYP-B805]
MKKTAIGSFVIVLLLALLGSAACTPDKQRGAEDLGPGSRKNRYDAYGINFVDDNRGRDKGPAAMYFVARREQREPRLFGLIERRVERMPGVADAKILTYMDNMIVAVLPSGAPKRDQVNTRIDTKGSPVAPDDTVKNSPDGLHHQVVTAIRSRLQAETRYNLLYVTTNPALYQRVAELTRRIQTGQPISDDEMKSLMNDIGYTTKGYNLVD